MARKLKNLMLKRFSLVSYSVRKKAYVLMHVYFLWKSRNINKEKKTFFAKAPRELCITRQFLKPIHMQILPSLLTNLLLVFLALVVIVTKLLAAF